MSEGDYHIVVGFDGSKGAKRALRWAADEALLRRGSVEVVRVFKAGEFGSPEEQAAIEAKTLGEEVRSALGDEPGFEIALSACGGHAAKILVARSRQADMLVVGSRGHGGFAGLLMGSVSHQVSAHSGAPVVVVVRS